MIERIAEFLKMRDESVLPDEMDDAERRESAKAILELMREPADRMRVSALNTKLPGYGEPPLYEKIWKAMIDAALREETT